jgi:hypothetical protein
MTRITDIELGVPLVAHLAERECMLVFQIAAFIRIFAVGLLTLGKFSVLKSMQCVYLVI